MPVKRRLDKSRSHRITQEAIEAFVEKDMWGLHHALGLPPWHMSPLLRSQDPFGIPDQPPSSQSTCFDQSYEKAVELRAALLAGVKAAKQSRHTAS
ncbi:hypothetical protein [Microvirga sp. BSC39]|uniref:hypothetical protein n=1 Tax=Microvirga sp. BSC39 TaxID=1549810 RepID=UPI0004E922B1|nr:hypothetical protein [Microvirga sp. BSC39]KFG71037.1 hypothetical protein JH26_00380 [Microvirga sp. BSC39]